MKVKEEEKRKAEEYRVKLAEEERKRKEQREKERLEKERLARQPKRPPFNFEREKPQILIGIANASQAATSLVNACRVSCKHGLTPRTTKFARSLTEKLMMDFCLA